ncbi:hypothetical protein [Kribbella sp. NPDC051770]|uniref:hypothetical protein n=1 Tax=Kribbella sp. NPDC051770 TaxID=3155413 RepID=UPI0034275D89
MNLDRVLVENNQSVGGGGGVWLGFGALHMYKGSLVGNSTTSNGGGTGTIDATGPFDLSFDETPINHNSATGDGGGLAVTNGAVATLSHVTMADDEAVIGEHVAAVPAAQVRSGRSAIVLPKAGTSCAGIGGAFAGTSLGFSVRRDASCGSIASDLVTAADPQLAALAGNGFSRVRVPAPASPLGGRVPVASCLVEDDQRMMPRPAGANCEAGSVEIVEAPSLIADVKALHLPKAVEAALVLKLELARVAVQRNQKPVAKALLTAFVLDVKLLAAQKIVPAPAAAQLVAKATAIRNSL